MKVLLIGDSIRMGYEPFLRASLPEGWELMAPGSNCQSTSNILSHWEEWIDEPCKVFKEDSAAEQIIHINAGLHDIRYDPGSLRPVTQLEDYRDNLNRLFSGLSKVPAQIVWATSTPFLEDQHNREKDSRRFFSDLEGYNRVACEMARARGVRVNDLFSVLVLQGFQQHLQSDGIHYQESGYRIMAKAVLNYLKQTEPGAK